jgi:hypothetical protein
MVTVCTEEEEDMAVAFMGHLGCMEEVECMAAALEVQWVVMAWELVLMVVIKIPIIHMVPLLLRQDFGFLCCVW